MRKKPDVALYPSGQLSRKTVYKKAALRKHGRPLFLMKHTAIMICVLRAISDARPFAAGHAIAGQRATASPLPGPQQCQ